MPLNQGGSDAARSENIATEIKAGKPRAQAVAIGYAVQRRSKGKRGSGVNKEVSEHMHKIKSGLRT